MRQAIFQHEWLRYTEKVYGMSRQTKQTTPLYGVDLALKKVYFRSMGREPSILKLSQSDEEKELEFELNYLASLTFEERLRMMRQKSREMLRQMVEHGHRRPFEIVKRTQG